MAKTAGSNEASEPQVSAIAAPVSYEAALAELEALVGRMEGGALSLEDSLDAYRRGATLVAFCQQQLEKVEQQVRVLDGESLKPLPVELVDDIGDA
jgi:exodeoxyribonuclease VII small subunit